MMKSETRDPKPEGRPRPEARIGWLAQIRSMICSHSHPAQIAKPRPSLIALVVGQQEIDVGRQPHAPVSHLRLLPRFRLSGFVFRVSSAAPVAFLASLTLIAALAGCA